MARVRAIDAGDDGEEIRFEGSNITFGGVASVGIWGNELVCCVPFRIDGILIGGASFVVEDLEDDLMLIVVDSTYNVVVSCDTMNVSS